MTIHWKALDEHFLMVPLFFRFNNLWEMHFLNFSQKTAALLLLKQHELKVSSVLLCAEEKLEHTGMQRIPHNPFTHLKITNQCFSRFHKFTTVIMRRTSTNILIGRSSDIQHSFMMEIKGPSGHCRHEGIDILT
jgi:hypothetical protein